MTGLLDEAGRLQLPARIRARSAPEGEFSSRLALADRIAELPDIHTVERSLDTLPCSVDVFLCKLAPAGRKQRPAVLLCSISRDGIAVHGLGDWDRYEVLSNGWGKLHRDRMLVFLPRDERELEVCWHILQSAYRLLSEVSAVAPPQRMTSPWDLPRFSRTPLQ